MEKVFVLIRNGVVEQVFSTINQDIIVVDVDDNAEDPCIMFRPDLRTRSHADIDGEAVEFAKSEGLEAEGTLALALLDKPDEPKVQELKQLIEEALPDFDCVTAKFGKNNIPGLYIRIENEHEPRQLFVWIEPDMYTIGRYDEKMDCKIMASYPEKAVVLAYLKNYAEGYLWVQSK